MDFSVDDQGTPSFDPLADERCRVLFRRALLSQRRDFERRKQQSGDPEERYELASQILRCSALLARLVRWEVRP